MKKLTGLTVPLFSVLIALFFGGIMIAIQGINPFLAYEVLFTKAFGSVDGIA